jgi:hypothetical protein
MGLVYQVMPEDCQSEKAFCVKHGLSINSTNAIRVYTDIPGFFAEVDKEKHKLKHYLLSAGMKALTKRAAGMVLRSQVLDKNNNVRDLSYDLAPDVRAGERLVQLGGGDITDKVEISGLAEAIAKTAKEIKKDE